MWVFTNMGFFSVTLINKGYPDLPLPEDHKNRSYVMVRARVRGDLIGLRHAYLELRAEVDWEHAPFQILEMPGHDYPYRVLLPQDHWAALLSKIGEEIDYVNFKDSVTSKQGRARHDLYMKIWSVMWDAERWLDEKAAKLRQPRPRSRQRSLWEGPPVTKQSNGSRRASDPFDFDAFPSIEDMAAFSEPTRPVRRGRSRRKKTGGRNERSRG
jgi:hypothetical protein